MQPERWIYLLFRDKFTSLTLWGLRLVCQKVVHIILIRFQVFLLRILNMCSYIFMEFNLSKLSHSSHPHTCFCISAGCFVIKMFKPSGRGSTHSGIN